MLINTTFGLHMLEEHAWGEEMLEGNGAEELYALLKKALEMKLFQAATTLAVCLIGHKDVTPGQHLFILANAGKMDGGRLIQAAKRLIEEAE